MQRLKVPRIRENRFCDRRSSLLGPRGSWGSWSRCWPARRSGCGGVWLPGAGHLTSDRGDVTVWGEYSIVWPDQARYHRLRALLVEVQLLRAVALGCEKPSGTVDFPGQGVVRSGIASGGGLWIDSVAHVCENAGAECQKSTLCTTLRGSHDAAADYCLDDPLPYVGRSA